MSKKNRKRIDELERQVAYLDAMVRHYIALQEQDNDLDPDPVIAARQQWRRWQERQLPPIPAGGLNILYPYPFDSGTTSTPLPDPPYRVTCDGTIGSATVLAHEATLSSAWLSPEDNEAWERLSDEAMSEFEEDLKADAATYPKRARIVDVVGVQVFPGVLGNTPDVSKPHVGKFGLAEQMDNGLVRITLDDGAVIWGHQCWWVPVEDTDNA